MRWFIRLIACGVVLSPLPAVGADITGRWNATLATAIGETTYTYVFRQSSPRLIGTVTSSDVVASTNGYINYKTITFDENATVEGRRAVLDYAGKLVSAKEIRFKSEIRGSPYSVVQLLATRIDGPWM